MADPFDFWIPARPPPLVPAMLANTRLDLPTMLLRDAGDPRADRRGTGSAVPTLIVAPFALHDATIADFDATHSLVRILGGASLQPLALTQWKSATPAMRDFGIDTYLAELNVAVDDLGGRARLVGLCQGGWLAAVYAARFPGKVAALVLAGAPIDVEAAPSEIVRSIATVTPAAVRFLVNMAGGLVLGHLSLPFWSDVLQHEFDPEAVLQMPCDSELAARIIAWNKVTLDLPGLYFLQTADWIFRQNRLALGCFPALGRICRLSDIDAPIFVLAGEDDDVVPAPQALAIERLCPHACVTTRVVPGNHLSLFLGRKTLDSAWTEIAAWLSATESHVAGPAARPKRRVKRSG